MTAIRRTFPRVLALALLMFFLIVIPNVKSAPTQTACCSNCNAFLASCTAGCAGGPTCIAACQNAAATCKGNCFRQTGIRCN
jgi:hypothetical protein